MAEVLEAILQLDINSFTAALQQAAQQVTAFAQAIQGSVGSSAHVFQEQVQQINQVVTVTKQAAQTKKDSAKEETDFQIHMDKLRLENWKMHQAFKKQTEKEDLVIAKQAAVDNMAQEKAVGEFIMKQLAERQAAEKTLAAERTNIQKLFLQTYLDLEKRALAERANLQKDFLANTIGMEKDRVTAQRVFLDISIAFYKEALVKQTAAVQEAAKLEGSFYRQMSAEKQQIFRQMAQREREETQRRVADEKRAAAEVVAAWVGAGEQIAAAEVAEATRAQQRRRMRSEVDVLLSQQGVRDMPGLATASLTPANQLLYLQGYNTLVQQAAAHTGIFDAAVSRVVTSLKTLGGYFAASFIIGIPFAIAAWGKEAAEAAVKMESVTASFKAITGSAQGAANTLGFLRGVANRMGLDFFETANQFKNLEAAARGTRLEGDKIRVLFEQVSMAQRVMGLSGEQASRGLLAIEQMVSKGTITMEELRKQLSQAIPGSVGIMARALGIGTEELTKLMKAGELLAEDVLPRFGRQLEKELGPGLKTATETAQATFARFGNNLRDISIATGGYILTMLKPIMDTINKGFELYSKAKAAAAEQRESGVGAVPEHPGAIPGAGDLNKRVDRVFHDLTGLQENLRVFNAEKNSIWMKTMALVSGRSTEEVIGKQEDAIRDLQAAWKKVSEERVRFLESQKDIGLPEGEGSETPFSKQIKAINEETKKFQEALAQLRIQKQNVPALFMGKGELEETREGLQKIEQKINDITKIMATAKAAGEGQVIPEFQKQLEQYNAEYKAQRARLTGLEEEAALKKQLEAEDRARRDRLRAEENQRQQDAKRITEDFQREIAGQTEGETEKKLTALKQQLDAARKAKVDETLITQMEAATRVKIYAEEAKEASKFKESDLNAIKKRRTDAEATEAMITRFSTQATRTRIDDHEAEAAKAIESMQARIDAGESFEEDMTRLVEAAAARRGRIVQEEQDKASKEAQKSWREFANTIESTIAGAFQSILSGSKSLWEGLRDGFLKLLIKLGADALAHRIIIPAIIGFIGGGSAGGGGGGVAGAAAAISGIGGATGGTSGGGGGGGDILGTALGLASAGNSVSAALGGPSLSLTGGLAGVGTLGSIMGTQLGFLPGIGTALGGVGPGMVGAPATALGATTVGTLVGGIGAGIAVGMVLKQLNNMLGIKGTAGTVLAGAGGGALAGTMILPGIGTAIGTVVGALGGLIASLVGKEPKPPGFDIQQIQPGQVNYNDIVGMQISQPFDILKDFHQRLGTDYEEFVGSVEDGINEMFASVIAQVSGASPDVQRALVGPLNEAFARVASAIASYPSIEGGDFKKRIELMMQDFGTYFEQEGGAAVAELMSAVQRIDPIIKAFNQIIEGLLENIRQLEQQQRELNTSLENNLTTLRESLMSPGDILRARKMEFDTLLTQFEGGDEATQIALAPRIGELANAILELSKNVFQQSFGDLTGIQAGQRTIGESLFSPQQSLNARYADLERLMGDFTAGTAAMQTLLAPQITQLTAQIMDLTKAVIAEREALMITFPAQIRSLTEALYTPTEQLTAAQVHLQELLREFRGAAPRDRCS